MNLRYSTNMKGNIFKINPEEFDLVGKKVAFLKVGNKAGYFDSTRSPERKGTTVGGEWTVYL